MWEMLSVLWLCTVFVDILLLTVKSTSFYSQTVGRLFPSSFFLFFFGGGWWGRGSCQSLFSIDMLWTCLRVGWEEFRNVYLLMTWVTVLRWPCVVDRTLKSNYYYYWCVCMSTHLLSLALCAICKCLSVCSVCCVSFTPKNIFFQTKPQSQDSNRYKLLIHVREWSTEVCWRQVYIIRPVLWQQRPRCE